MRTVILPVAGIALVATAPPGRSSSGPSAASAKSTAISGSMQINPDGSGTLTFKDLAGDSGKISGSVSWTCVESR